jgi:hypothetical protein
MTEPHDTDAAPIVLYIEEEKNAFSSQLWSHGKSNVVAARLAELVWQGRLESPVRENCSVRFLSDGSRYWRTIASRTRRARDGESESS